MDVEKFKQEFKSEFLDFEFTEIKTENTIQRHKGSAQHPRQVERIPKGSEFKLKLILDLYEGDNHDWLLKQLALAFELIELDYVGGHGSKGSGEVKINLNKFETRFYGEGHAKLSEKEAGWKAIFNNFLLPN